LKATKRSSERTYTVTPLPEVDPQFTVTVRDLADADVSRIYDKHGYMPGSPKATMAKLVRVVKDTIDESIVGWTNFNDDAGHLHEVTRENKLLFYETPVEIDGESTTLWLLVQSKVAEQRRAEAKN
jgi:hypothetical protein